MLGYTLVVLYCTSRVECWKEVQQPLEAFVTEDACRRALETRARTLLQPHFEQEQSNIGIVCEAPGEVAAGSSERAEAGGRELGRE
jgi:hypothetical protein